MIYAGLDEDKYHESEGLSQSTLKLLSEEGGPAKVRYGHRAETAPQKFGSLIHTAVLEPTLLEQRYCITDLTREGTKAWDAEAAAAIGRIMVKRPAYEEALRIRDAVMQWSDVANMLLTPSPHLQVEQSFFWTDPISGRLCKGRCDAFHAGHRAMVDLKSANDASYEGFRRAVRDYGYHIQNAHYEDGWPLAGGGQVQDFVFIVVEKEEPYLSAAYQLDAADVAEGREQIRALISYYEHCEATNDWPGYPRGLQSLSMHRSNR
jgi:exodeoxyribonuclease VIII